jgi:hypothetical protein
MQRHRRQCRRINDREWRCVGKVKPKRTGSAPACMGVPKGPIAAIRVGQARIMIMMIRFRQRPRAVDTRASGKSEWQEDLGEQRGDR